MGDEIEKFKASEEGKEFWGARMIWTTIRQFGKKGVIESELFAIYMLSLSMAHLHTLQVY